ncbi:MAG TPA: TraB/GumN family protein [Chitinophagaceae bacterium]
MKSMWIALGLLSVLSAGSQIKSSRNASSGTKSKSASTVKKISDSLENTLLWAITGNGLKDTSYLFGTMHLLCAEDARLSVNLKKAIRQTDRIYFEIDMDDMSQMMSALKYARMNDNTKLSDLLTAEEYKRIKEYFEKNRSILPFSMMERFKPYMITSMIGETGMGCEKTNGMEFSIMQEAKKYDKDIFGLETAEFQAGLFDSIPYEKQAKELLGYIDSIDRQKTSTSELIKVYREQNLQKMEEMTVRSEGGIGEYIDLLVFDRNRRWLEQLNFILKEKPTLIAVGAGHLPGENGMIKLLRKAGYNVKPLKNTPPPPPKPESEST